MRDDDGFDRCVCCGKYVPEGRMVCYSCEAITLPAMETRRGAKRILPDG